MFDILIKPFGMILGFLYSLTGNYGLALFAFTLIVNLAMLPLTIKGQSSMANQARIRPKLDELKKKYGDDKVRFNTEMQALYQREGISMTSGCLPQILRMVFVLLIYQVVYRPLTFILNVPASVINEAKTALSKMTELNLDIKTINEQTILGHIGKLTDIPGLQDVPQRLNFNLLGLDLSQTPKFGINIFEAFQPIWIIPFLAFATAMLSSVVSSRVSKMANPDAPQMTGLIVMMPFVSLFFAFKVPGAVGFYWACSNVVSGAIQIFVQMQYSPAKMVAKLQADAVLKRREAEKKKLLQIAEKAAQEE